MTRADFELWRKEETWLNTLLPFCHQCHAGLLYLTQSIHVQVDGTIRFPFGEGANAPRHSDIVACMTRVQRLHALRRGGKRSLPPIDDAETEQQLQAAELAEVHRRRQVDAVRARANLVADEENGRSRITGEYEDSAKEDALFAPKCRSVSIAKAARVRRESQAREPLLFEEANAREDVAHGEADARRALA